MELRDRDRRRGLSPRERPSGEPLPGEARDMAGLRALPGAVRYRYADPWDRYRGGAKRTRAASSSAGVAIRLAILSPPARRIATPCGSGSGPRNRASQHISRGPEAAVRRPARAERATWPAV